MKKIIIIFTIVVLFSSSAFGKKENKLDISEETGVKGWIVENNAKNYCKKYKVKLIRLYNIKVIEKNEVRSNIGAIIKSYLVTAEAQVERYGHFYTAFYVYTGEMLDGTGEMYSVNGYFASKKYHQMNGLKKYIFKKRKLVKGNTALNIASLELLTM